MLRLLRTSQKFPSCLFPWSHAEELSRDRNSFPPLSGPRRGAPWKPLGVTPYTKNICTSCNRLKIHFRRHAGMQRSSSGSWAHAGSRPCCVFKNLFVQGCSQFTVNGSRFTGPGRKRCDKSLKTKRGYADRFAKSVGNRLGCIASRQAIQSLIDSV